MINYDRWKESSRRAVVTSPEWGRRECERGAEGSPRRGCGVASARDLRKGKTAAPVTYHTLVLHPRPGLGTKGKPSVGEKPTTRERSARTAGWTWTGERVTARRREA